MMRFQYPCLIAIWSLLWALAIHGNSAAAGEDASCRAVSDSPDEGGLVAMERRQRELLADNEGKRIRDIVYYNANVFRSSEAEKNSLFRLANRLHVTTREEVLAAQLLFEPGDPLTVADVVESERLLRQRSYLANAFILVTAICRDSVDLAVFTRDAWTTEPQISFGHSGGETRSGFSLSEGNFLGTGNSVAVGYSKDEDRSGVTYNFSSPHFLNSRLFARFGYANNTDGEDTLVEIGQPFYSLRTPRSYGFRSEKLIQIDPIRFRGEEINEFQHKIERHEVYFGQAIKIERGDTHRLLVGITKERDRFATTSNGVGRPPVGTNLLYPWIEYQFLEHEYAVYFNLNQIQRIEDVPMGKQFSLRVGYGGETFDNADDVIRLIGEYSDILEVGKNHILKFSGYLDGRHHSHLSDQNTTIAGGELAYWLLRDQKNRWFARFRYDMGKDLQIHEELTVGGMVGVRGYPLDYQRGDRRYIFSVERRYYSDLHLFNLLHLGGVVFFDAGRAWNSEMNIHSPHLANVGLGLRLSSSKAKIGHIVHLDVAFPTTDREDADSVQWLLTAEQAF